MKAEEKLVFDGATVTKDRLLREVTVCRSLQKSGNFIKQSKQSIRLYGRTSVAVIKSIGRDSDERKKTIHELILLDDEMSAERFDGEAVTLSSVYTSSDDVVFACDNIAFKTEDGILLSANQYEYIKNLERQGKSLPPNSYFAKSNNKDADVRRVWRDLTRKAGEARRDKAKDVLYLTIGTVKWTTSQTATAKEEEVTSPLLQCQIIEDTNSKDKPRFRIIGDCIKANSILAREFKEKHIDLFNGIAIDNIPLGDYALRVLSAIVENAKQYPDIQVNIDDMNICILDSTYESICQLIENNIEKLAQSPLIKVLSGEISYTDLPVNRIAPYAIYPLPTDDSQKKVLERVMAGESMNISAAAGTGKSHLMVLIAASMVAAGANLCVMSEKSAANEVFLKYAKRIGLDKYCLEINNKTTVSQIINQLEKISNTARVYLDPVKTKYTLDKTATTEKVFDDYNNAVYSNIPGLDISLYELIGEAISREKRNDLSSLTMSAVHYRAICLELDNLQQVIDNTVCEKDYEMYINNDDNLDSELYDLINEPIEALKEYGVDVVSFVKSNDIKAKDISAVIKANIARMFAQDEIEKKQINRFGNLKLRKEYAQLVESYEKMQSIYSGYMQQQVSERIVKAVSQDSDMPNLSRLKTAKITLQDFFKQYGKSIMKMCPIIVTTPSAAVSYITEDMNTFNALLIDEASQVPIISVLPFLTADRQLIAFGDNMQLDISSFFTSSRDNGYNEKGEFDLSLTDKSILHMVQGKIPNERLSYHYRSKTQHLVAVSNKTCYNDMLNITPDVYTGWDKLPESLGFELIKIDVPFDTQKAQNDLNAYQMAYRKIVEQQMLDQIIDHIQRLQVEYPDKSIGIVTLNDYFQGKIYDIIEDMALEGEINYDPDNEENGIWVRSLEKAQGKEADIVIIAIDHSQHTVDGSLFKNISGYFNAGKDSEQSGNNRLNVLFTRAREKNIIYIAFDYHEIKNTSGSLKRLYTYLEYSDTGKMSHIESQSNLMDKTNDYASKVIGRFLDNKEIREKIGSNALMVDIGILDKTNQDKYEVGFILPDRKITNNALYTKINLLERAGWYVQPLSLVYLLDKHNAIKNQITNMLAEKKGNFVHNISENYLTSKKPLVSITLEDIENRGNYIGLDSLDEETSVESKESDKIAHLSLEEFARLDIEQIVRAKCSDDIKDVTQDFIENNFKSNPQALLIKIAQNAHKAALDKNGPKIVELTKLVYNIYKNRGIDKARFLLGHLLRTMKDVESEGNQNLIRDLLREE